MFGSVGAPELLFILVLALLLFGPRRLPQIGRTVGRALAEIRGATREFKLDVEQAVDLEAARDATGARSTRSESRERGTSPGPDAVMPGPSSATPRVLAPPTETPPTTDV